MTDPQVIFRAFCVMLLKRRQAISIDLCHACVSYFNDIGIIACFVLFLSRCEHGVLTSCYPGNVLMPFQGRLPFKPVDDTSHLPRLSLREAAGAKSHTITNKINVIVARTVQQ